MRRVLVVGSQGFVGGYVRRALVARECAVVGMDRPGTRAEVTQDMAATSDWLPAVVQAVGRVDAVIYMAANITRGSSVGRVARTNVGVIAEAPLRLFEALARTGAAHVVYCSSYKVYGPAETPIDPSRGPRSPDPWSYGAAKALAERLLAVSAARFGYRFAIVRPTCIYGPGQHARDAIPTFLRRAWSGQRPVVFGDGSSVRDDVLAADVATCLVEAALRRAEGAFNAAGERAHTILEVARSCCEAVAGAGGPKGLEPLVDPAEPAKWWLDQRFDSSRSQRVLGYKPTAFSEGLRGEAEWVRDHAMQ